jgi:hypothetical protein
VLSVVQLLYMYLASQPARGTALQYHCSLGTIHSLNLRSKII